MPIHLLASGIGSPYFPTEYAFPLAGVLLVATVVRAWASGPSNTRQRNLHGRTVILTGGFTPTGVTILSKLAENGAQVIALVPTLSDPVVHELISAIRISTSNELVFAEQCDLSSPVAIREFCSKFVKSTGTGVSSSEPPRIDAIIYAHEYAHIGAFGAPRVVKEMEKAERTIRGYATFLMTTLFLPLLLRSPLDRDIRIIRVINPYYAASVPTFIPGSPPDSARSSIWEAEGDRSLRSVITGKHLQRILDAIATSGAVPKTSASDEKKAEVPQKASNISSLTVSPGISRLESVFPFLVSPLRAPGYSSLLGSIMYYLLLPLLFLFAKSPSSAAQTVLYALALPTPQHQPPPESSPPQQSSSSEQSKPIELLEGGKLYRDCAVVSFSDLGNKMLEDEAVGRAVWEVLEKGILDWDKEHKKGEGDKAKEEVPPTKTNQPSDENKGKGKQKDV